MSVKHELRDRFRKGLAEIPPEELHRRSLCACHHLFEQPEYLKAEVVMAYLPLAREVDTAPLVLRCWQDRKRVLAPKVSWNQRRMIALEIRSLTDDLQLSSFGIREPVSGIPIPVDLIDLLILPGLGFDEYGNRLGRGRGFYDRFLAHPDFAGVTCGLALEEQVCPNLPAGPLDRRIRMLVTDTSVRRFDP